MSNLFWIEIYGSHVPVARENFIANIHNVLCVPDFMTYYFLQKKVYLLFLVGFSITICRLEICILNMLNYTG